MEIYLDMILYCQSLLFCCITVVLESLGHLVPFFSFFPHILTINLEKYFSYFSTKTYVVDTQKDRLNETVLFDYPKHMFKWMSKKIIIMLG